MDNKLLCVYFLLGGTIVTLITYFGSQAKGLIAAFIAFFPSITLITIITIYLHGGISPTTSYLKGMLLLLPAWLLYLLAVLFLLPRLGLVSSLLLGTSLYLGSALATMKVIH